MDWKRTVKVYSKPEFRRHLDEFKNDPGTAIISIECTPDCVKYRLEADKGDFDNEHLLESSERVLNLDFDDVPGPYDLHYKEHWMLSMSGKQAYEIVRFIEKHVEEERSFVIHCKAGESRSRAIGEFILEFFGNKYMDGNPDNPISEVCNVDVLTKLKDKYYSIHHLMWHRDNETSILKESEEDAGKYISLACFNSDYQNEYYDKAEDKDIGYLLGAIDGVEDYYWVYLDKDHRICYRSCACGYGVIWDERRFPNISHPMNRFMDDLKEEEKETLKTRIRGELEKEVHLMETTFLERHKISHPDEDFKGGILYIKLWDMEIKKEGT